MPDVSEGWGRLTWGQAGYGQATTIQEGWGRLAWGKQAYGDSPTVTLSGLSATTSVGTPEVEVRPGWGTLNWGENGWGSVDEGIENLIPDSSFSLMSPWIIRTPPGYSCYFTAPINGENPHIRLFSGIVNTDTYFNHVNFFFGFREHSPAHGILKQGMPLVQIIPFKREEWTASITPLMPNTEEAYNQQNVKNGIDSVYIGGYKKHHGCPVKFA